MPLAYFFNVAQDVVITLDAVTSLSTAFSANPTDSPVQTGYKVTDHYVVDPEVRRVSGVISDTKINSFRNPLSQAEFLEELKRVIRSSTPFTFHSDREGIENLQNCLILSYNLTAQSADGLLVELTFREVDIQNAAEVVDIELRIPSESSEKTVAGNKDTGDGGTKEVDEITSKTALEDIDTFTRSLIGG